MEFLSRSAVGDVPLVAFGSSDGVIRVLSMISWKVRGQSSFCSVVLIMIVSCVKFYSSAACTKIYWRA